MVLVRTNILASIVLLSSATVSGAAKTQGIPVSGAKPEPDCQTIPDLACSTDDLSTLCSLINLAGLEDALSDPNLPLTVFAPTNDAFGKVPTEDLESIVADEAVLNLVLTTHVAPQVVKSTDLECNGSIVMLNGMPTTTNCDGSGVFQQVGAGNAEAPFPTITAADIPACGSKIVHLVDGVILPGPSPIDYCNEFGPDYFCFQQGHPACCFDDTKECPPVPPACDYDPSQGGMDYCNLTAEEGCYDKGKPACCFDETTKCPNLPPPCDGAKDGADTDVVLGADYCTFAPDHTCYNDGWPTCCFENNNADPCPSTPPSCDAKDERDDDNENEDYDYESEEEFAFDDAYIQGEEECTIGSIADLACSAPQFSTLCALVLQAGLGDVLANLNDSYTVFAPTNEAFDNLPASLIEELTANTELLMGVLLDHVVVGEVKSSDLECSKLVEMATGVSTRTKCLGPNHDLYQVGGGNTETIGLPKITTADIDACNGVIHEIDQVILPEGIVSDFDEKDDHHPHDNGDDRCESSIADLACGVDELSTLCELVIQAGLGDALNDPEASLTVFAPTNDAFGKLPDSLVAEVTSNIDLLTVVLLTHVAAGQIFSFDLECNQKVVMLSGEYTYTKCLGSDFFQVGGGNSDNALPMIGATDILGCNGVVHLVDAVILPGADDPYVPDHHEEHHDPKKEPHPVNPNIINYCAFERDYECYESGKPQCCLVQGMVCPIKQPTCDYKYQANGFPGNPSYCSFQPNNECYQFGRPECCFNNQLRCPDRPPVCDRKPTVQNCATTLDYDCYEFGKPRCCLVEGQNCPVRQPFCDYRFPVGGFPGTPPYCSAPPNRNCYQYGRPECCFNNHIQCPAYTQPTCDVRQGAYGYGYGYDHNRTPYGTYGHHSQHGSATHGHKHVAPYH